MKCIWRRCCFWKLFDFNQDKAGAPFLLSSIIIMHLKKWWKTETLKWFPDKKLRCIFPNLGQKLNEFWKNCIFATEVRSFLSAQKYLIFQLFYHFSQYLKIAQNFGISPNFVPLKVTCLVKLFHRKLQVFKNLPKWTIFGLFHQLVSTHNVNVARFARSVEWNFFCDFWPKIRNEWKRLFF